MALYHLLEYQLGRLKIVIFDKRSWGVGVGYDFRANCFYEYLNIGWLGIRWQGK